MEDIKYPKQLRDYRPTEKRPGRPLKRLQVGSNPEAETGNKLV